jgi:hypothetical protein
MSCLKAKDAKTLLQKFITADVEASGTINEQELGRVLEIEEGEFLHHLFSMLDTGVV